jgi:hypothetical protein
VGVTEKKTVKKRHPGHNFDGPGPGRKKGVPNRLSRTARENINEVYSRLGDIDGHVAFLERHPAEKAKFYADVYPKLLALQVEHSGPGGGPLVFKFSEDEN